MEKNNKFGFYKKNEAKKKDRTWIYIRIAIYLVCLIVIFVMILKIKKGGKSKQDIDRFRQRKIKAEIYGNGSIYNNYYYGVRLSRVSADWDINKVKDVYESSVLVDSLEERIKPLVRFVTKNRNKEIATVTLSTVILNEHRTSDSLAEESFNNLIKKFSEENIKVIQAPIPHNRGSLKAAFYVVEISHPDKTATFIELFVVKNNQAFNLHGETDPEKYDIYLWDFEHYINSLVIYL
ncbi:MAG: hypothetical protein HY934_06800 [Candidatus Firestonebacteria bacterium]|nr:hypothetical protein [Candidatus Firestonebacteria bacterium]